MSRYDNNILRRIRNNERSNDIPDEYLRHCSAYSLVTDEQIVTDFEDWCYAEQLDFMVKGELSERIIVDAVRRCYPRIYQITEFVSGRGIFLKGCGHQVYGPPSGHTHYHVNDYVLGRLVKDVVGNTWYDVYNEEYITIEILNAPDPKSPSWPTEVTVGYTASLIKKLFE